MLDVLFRLSTHNFRRQNAFIHGLFVHAAFTSSYDEGSYDNYFVVNEYPVKSGIICNDKKIKPLGLSSNDIIFHVFSCALNDNFIIQRK